MNKLTAIFIIFLLSCFNGTAQICSGSLGDPVVNVTFGSGSNPGGSLSTVSNNYVYSSTPCPNDGIYTLVNRSSGCHNNTWHDLPEDHTPNDTNGYMMLVNGSYTPGDFYVETVKGLCPGTTYEFAAWVANLLRPNACNGIGIKPNLTFTIQTSEGTILGTYNTGEITGTPVANWQQYGLFFTTPSRMTDITLKVSNNAPGGCGNDLVLDDITFRPCGARVNAVINYAGGTSIVDVCQGESQEFNLAATVSAGFDNPGYQWQVSTDSLAWNDIPGANTTQYKRNGTGTGNFFYRLAVADARNISSRICRVVSNVVAVRVNGLPVINASSNNPVCEQGPFNLEAAGGIRYVWSGPGGFSSTVPNPKFVANMNQQGTYYVTAVTAKGCSSTDSVKVVVYPKATVNAGADQQICEGTSVVLQGTAAASYQWSPATGLSSASVQNPVARPPDSTLYVLNIKDNNGCAATDSVRIHVYKKPVAIAGAEIQLFEGQSAMLNGTVRGTNIQYQWSPATYMTNSNSLTPTIQPKDTISYTLTVTSNSGCGTASSKVFVRVYQKVIVPNAFSPNGDGINEGWNIEKLQTYKNCQVTVFNRYGQIVFRSEGYYKQWDGKYNGIPVPVGTYYYTVDLKNGTKILNGWVAIIR